MTALAPPVTEVSLVSPFPMEYAGKLWRWLNEPATPNFDDFDEWDENKFPAVLEHRRGTQFTWLVEFQGSPCGYVAFVPQSKMAGFFKGIVIAPRYRCAGIGGAAVQLVMDQLQEAGISKFCALMFADNRHIWSMFTKLGYAQEGYLTDITQRDGKLMDMRLMSYPARIEGLR